ncbi:hypothetical protein K1719_046267 [Acacia pycnantha]|nr:hypothetical protein K1719_046267 [Acacia pycnantha]
MTMSITEPLKKLVRSVILDLDGTLLNTDAIVGDVLKVFLGKYGKQWDGREVHKIVGKTQFEAAVAIVEDYDLPCSTSEFLCGISPMFSDQWCNIKALPGADRLIKHLRNHGKPKYLTMMDGKTLSVILGGDEVRTGKPSPEIFLEASKRLNVENSSCIVIEDSVTGVTGGKATGMGKWGLPPFEDWVEGTLPIDPWCIAGPVIKGFGRGSKDLGIPTANLSTEGYSDLLMEHPAGVYFGWAGLSSRGVYKIVMSIGWNPYFNNEEKTIEPWLLHDFKEDFYGEELRLVIVGYIRPEANFPSLESLVAKIHEDGRIAERALDLPLYSSYKNDPFLRVHRHVVEICKFTQP